MSYCRWSSDDWRSDLYVYEGSDGIYVHVANRRRTEEFFDALPAPVALDGGPEAVDAWVERHQAVMALLGEHDELVAIDLPHAGTDAVFDTHDEAADAIEWLIACGFHVPDGVVDALRDDERDPVDR